MLSIVLYLSLSGLYLRVIPPGESPDEPSHLQCIEQVTRYGRIPVIDPKPSGNIWWARDRIISGLVCAHMPLYYFVAGYTQQVVQAITGTAAHYEFPPNNPGWETGESPAMFQHLSEPRTSEPLALAVLRWESIALGLVTLVAAGRVARRLMPDQPYAVGLAMILVAGWPQFVYMSRAINNDVLATALAASVVAVLVEVDRPNRFVAASALAVLAVMSKITMTFAAAAVVAVFIFEVAATPQRGRYVRAGLVSSMIFGGAAALILLQPTLRDHLDWSQRTIGNISPTAQTLDYWVQVGYGTLQSGWARLGWMNVFTPDTQAITWWAALGVTSLIGLVTALRDRQHRAARWGLIIGLIWLAAILAGYVRINLNRFQPQFRYAFASVPVLAGLSAAGWLALTRRRPRLQAWLLPAAAGLLLLANLWIIFGVVIPAYT